jgi:hypothetical protein
LAAAICFIEPKVLCAVTVGPIVVGVRQIRRRPAEIQAFARRRDERLTAITSSV